MDPQPTSHDFLMAETCVSILSRNLAIAYQVDGEKWDRATMQKHVNARSACLCVQAMLVNEAERIRQK